MTSHSGVKLRGIGAGVVSSSIEVVPDGEAAQAAGEVQDGVIEFQ